MRRRVVVVEDIESVRALHVAFLERLGCTVSQAADGLTGLAQIRAQRPDLVLLDIMMPGMSGYEVVQAVRADPDPVVRKTPIIMTTALAAHEIVKALLDLGVAAYLVKPISHTLLEREVTKVLGRASAPAPRPRVLVADDSGRDLDLMRAALKGKARVHIATTGQEAIERFEETSPAVVYLSLGITWPDGWRTLSAIRDRQARSAYYVALIPVGYPVDIALLHGSGFSNQIAKPIHARDVVTTLGAATLSLRQSVVTTEWEDGVPVVVIPPLESASLGTVGTRTRATLAALARAGHERVLLDLHGTQQVTSGVPRLMDELIAAARQRRLSVAGVAAERVAAILGTVGNGSMKYRSTRRAAARTLADALVALEA